VDDGEEPVAAAAREVEEETGWRPRSVELLLALQPMVGTADAEHLLFLGRGADYIGTPVDVSEAERVSWVPFDEVLGLVERGEIVGASSVAGLLYAYQIRRGLAS
jgi:8-oxo-dGTP pyrophosphatase MutT (NUDIX family)